MSIQELADSLLAFKNGDMTSFELALEIEDLITQRIEEARNDQP